MPTARIDFVDNLKAVAICLVVWGHLSVPRDVFDWIFSFHMPLFFFASGFLVSQKRLDAPLLAFLKDNARRYLIPYFILGPILLAHLALYSKIGHSVAIDMSRQWREFALGQLSVLWFLPVLFFAAFYFYALRRVCTIPTTLLVALAGTLAVVFFCQNQPYPWGVNTACVALFFYAVGAFAKQIFPPALERFGRRRISLLLFGLLLLTASWFAGTLLATGQMREAKYEGLLWFYPWGALLGIAALSFLCATFKSNTAIRWVSRNTLIIFGLQMIFISWIRAMGQWVFHAPYPHDRPEDCILYNFLILLAVIMLCIPAKYVLHKIFPNIFR